MINTRLSLLENCVVINGEYYTVSNGFISKTHGKIKLRYKDLLSVEFVKQRSKKIMYAMLLPAGLLMLAFNFEGFISVVIFAMLAIITSAIGVVYFFSARHFVEFTSMKGTYRIAVQTSDIEMEKIVVQIQKHIK